MFRIICRRKLTLWINGYAVSLSCVKTILTLINLDPGFALYHAGIIKGRMNSTTSLQVINRAIQSQRDLYIAMRDLFHRQHRLSIDQVDRLRKRVEDSSQKLESIKTAKKDSWEEAADKIVGLIEKDQATIQAQLNRKVYIRAW